MYHFACLHKSVQLRLIIVIVRLCCRRHRSSLKPLAHISLAFHPFNTHIQKKKANRLQVGNILNYGLPYGVYLFATVLCISKNSHIRCDQQN